MKLLLLLTISASMLIAGLVNADGYLKKQDGCWMPCLTEGYCNKYCHDRGGKFGYCYALGCWCEGLPDDKAWKKETSTC